MSDRHQIDWIALGHEKLLELAEQYDREGRAYVAAKLRVAAQAAQQELAEASAENTRSLPD